MRLPEGRWPEGRWPDGGARLRVAIAGATGTVGQKLVLLLARHPWFELRAVAASAKSVGRRYGEAVHWLEPEAIPAGVAELPVLPVDADLPCDFVLSALDAASAQELEPRLARAGLPVVSNASAHRMDPAVPLLVPEVNPEHVALVEQQPYGDAFVVTNPNCSVVGLAMALVPLVSAFGVEQVMVTTMQAVSGAGYPGVPALDILGNVLPWIAGEEDKIECEPRKIFGRLRDGRIEPAAITISAQANRVPVIDGHTESVSVKLGRRVSVDEARSALASFASPLAALGLPSAPEQPLVVVDDERGPQPRLHAGRGGGLAVSVGRLKPCPVLDLRFVLLVHNTLRGAAAGALLNAELLARLGKLRPRRG